MAITSMASTVCPQMVQFKYKNTYIIMNICNMIIIMYCNVSSILTKTAINTYVAANVHAFKNKTLTHIYICTYIYITHTNH